MLSSLPGVGMESVYYTDPPWLVNMLVAIEQRVVILMGCMVLVHLTV